MSLPPQGKAVQSQRRRYKAPPDRSKHSQQWVQTANCQLRVRQHVKWRGHFRSCNREELRLQLSHALLQLGNASCAGLPQHNAGVAITIVRELRRVFTREVGRWYEHFSMWTRLDRRARGSTRRARVGRVPEWTVARCVK